ncbi:MAG: precorrin-8X methylmutase [Chloroflexaceae bacterium]|nr:precorrin-8X methylmutase [Chloroflexaceae bacterium]
MNRPAAIAADSFAIIRQRLTEMGHRFDPPMAVVVERIIHSTADFEFADLVRASPGALQAGKTALLAGCPIITDVNMVKVGISTPRLTRLGNVTYCFVASEEVQKRAEAEGTTRSALGMRAAAEHSLMRDSIVAVGNAPTALYEVVRLIQAGERPALVIGVPVGFVGTTESKAALMEQTTVPWIVTTGCKGGSTIAVAMLNALLRLATEGSNSEL